MEKAISEKSGRIIEKSIILFFLILPLATIALKLNNDAWFLLAHGKHVFTEGIPFVEPFTIHENFDFVMQQWLFSAVFWFLYNSLGEVGLIAGVFLCAIILMLLLYKLSLLVSCNAKKISAICTAVAMLGLCIWFLETRPQTVTYIIIVVEILLLELYAKTEKARYLVGLPLLSVIEVNMHASMWGMLFIFALPYLAGSIKFEFYDIKSKGYKKIPLIVTIIAMLLCGFINPYGIDAMKYVLSSFGDEVISNVVQEMMHIAITDSYGLYFFGIIFAIALLLRYNKTIKIEVRYALLLGGTALMTLITQKSLAYFFIGCVPFLVDFTSNLENHIKIDFQNKKKNKIYKLLPFYFVLIIGLCFYINIDKSQTEKNEPLIKKAVEFLENEKVDKSTAKLYTGYDNGGYAEFKGYKVYIDPRAEVFLKKNNNQKDVFDEYIKLQFGSLDYRDFLETYEFTHFVLDKSDILCIYLKDNEKYKQIYNDETSEIYVPVK